MKITLKRVLLLVAMMLTVATIQAQTLQEVVYLKNGSIVRGVIIEQIPNKSLKIQTADGSIFAYQMDEVDKITKEAAISRFYRNGGGRFNFDDGGRSAGYRGFVDLGYTVGTGVYGEDRIEVSTSHGYQFNPYIYLGLGAGVHYYFGSEIFEIPIFAHVRSEFLKNSISPFVDFKIGYSVFDATGFYMTPSVGCRFAIGEKNGISAGIGYTMQKAETWWGTTENCGGFNIRVGFDF